MEIVLTGKRLRKAFEAAENRFGVKAFEGVARFVSRGNLIIV